MVEYRLATDHEAHDTVAGAVCETQELLKTFLSIVKHTTQRWQQ